MPSLISTMCLGYFVNKLYGHSSSQVDQTQRNQTTQNNSLIEKQLTQANSSKSQRALGGILLHIYNGIPPPEHHQWSPCFFFSVFLFILLISLLISIWFLKNQGTVLNLYNFLSKLSPHHVISIFHLLHLDWKRIRLSIILTCA